MWRKYTSSLFFISTIVCLRDRFDFWAPIFELFRSTNRSSMDDMPKVTLITIRRLYKCRTFRTFRTFGILIFIQWTKTTFKSIDYEYKEIRMLHHSLIMEIYLTVELFSAFSINNTNTMKMNCLNLSSVNNSKVRFIKMSHKQK